MPGAKAPRGGPTPSRPVTGTPVQSYLAQSAGAAGALPLSAGRGLVPLPSPCLPGPFARPSAAHNGCAHRPFPSYRALLGCGIAASLPPHRFTALYTHPRRKVKIRNFILWLREVRGVHEARHPISFCRHKKRGRISAAPHGMDIWQAYPSPASLGSPLSIPAACGRYELYHLKCPSYPMFIVARLSGFV